MKEHQTNPEQRVAAFLADWHKQWVSAKKRMGDNVDFKLWGAMVSEVDNEHFLSGSHSDTSNSFGSTPDFDPEVETITHCKTEGDTALVSTEIPEETAGITKYHAYALVRGAEGNWLISSVLTFYSPPNALIFEESKHQNILQMAISNSELMGLNEDIALDENLLFQGKRHVLLGEQESLVTVKRIGEFNLKSGIIGIVDFGYDFYKFEPLERKVKPGKYAVEVASVKGRVAGIRISLDNSQATNWFFANTASGNGVYGVDAGNLAIFDVENILKLTNLGKETLFSQWVKSGEPEIISMFENDDCVITPSGFGDGAYPAFWGVNQQGVVVSLYIDFMILVKEVEGVFNSI